MAAGRKRLGLAASASAFAGVLVLAAAAGVGLATYLSFSAALVEREKAALLDETGQLARRLSTRVERLRADTAFLAATHAVTRYVLASHSDPVDGKALAETRAGVEGNFLDLLRVRPDYRQARLIGVGGRELVRAERTGADARLVGADQLQQEETASYFGEAIQTPPDVVYLSKVELNREHGEISTPHTPVLRAAVSVRSSDGSPFGIVVINLDFGSLVETLTAELPAHRRLYVLNQRSDFLSHPDPSRAFRFEHGESYRAEAEFPGIDAELWRNIEGRFAVVHQNESGEEMILGAHREPIDPARTERNLTVALDVPANVVLAASLQARDRSLTLAAVFILGSVALGFWATRRLISSIGGEPDEIEVITSRVAGGDLEIVFDERQRAAAGILGSVRQMVDALREARRVAGEREWLNSELARVLTIAQRQPALPELARSVITELARLCQAGAGAFFARTLETEEEGSLALLATFAHEQRRSLPARVKPGDGLVGQCVLERQPILLTRVPPDYVEIRSGLGRAAPLQVLVLPVSFGEDAVAAIELASFESLGGVRRELLDQLCGTLGVIVNGLVGKERTARLLRETQELSEEAQAQSEELRVTNEELEEKGRALEKQRAELETQGEELRVANEELEERTTALERQNAQSEAMNQDLLRARRELESASAYKSEFLANMSHELRTPLNSLLILARSLTENPERNLTAEQMEAASVIYRGGQDLLQLINDILDLSKVEAGKLDLQLEEIDPSAVAREMHAEFRPLAEQAGLEFRLETDTAEPHTIRTDDQRLRQILRNLLANAFKFTAQGSVALRVSREESGSVCFAIADTGVGIPADKLQAVFEAFQQADGSITRRYGGTGLGLAISRKLASLLAGEIQVASQEGQGSTFTLRLPERGTAALAVAATPPAPTREPSAAAAPAAPMERRARTVLVIEDDAPTRRAVRERLAAADMRVVEAASGSEARASLRAELCDCIVLDLKLGDEEGRELLRDLAGQLGSALPPVIVYTGRELPRSESRALQEFSETVVVKGVSSLDRLVEEVSRFTHGAEPFSPARAQRGTAAARETDRVLAGRTALLVDDDMRNAYALSRLLREQGMDVLIAENGAVALEQLEEHPRVDVVLMDVMMPVLDGYETMRRIRADERFKELPIIALTAKAMAGDRERCLSAGASDYLAKPLDVDRLMSLLRVWLFERR